MNIKPTPVTWILVVLFSMSLPPKAAAQGPYTCPDSTAQCAIVQSQAPNNKPVGWIIGEIRQFAFGGNPGTKTSKVVTQMHALGWLECEGQALSSKDFTSLHDVIGETWGGNTPQFVFFVPDLRGAFLRGWNHTGSQKNPDGTIRPPQFSDPDADSAASPRVPPRTKADVGTSGLQGNGGDAVGSMQSSALQHHKHIDSGHQHDLPLIGQDTGAGGRIGADSETQSPPRKVTSFPGAAILGDAVPLNQNPALQTSDETRPSNAYVMYFIYVGKAITSQDLGGAARAAAAN